MLRREGFPQTRATWIGKRLDAGRTAREEVLRHVMAVYVQPLQAYVRRSRYHWVGEAEDVVHGFFAEWLPRDGYLQRWQASGRLLRDWLANGVWLYLHELARARQRESRRVELAETPPAPDPEPLEAMCASFAATVGRLAMEEAAARCHAAGLDAHWQAFALRHCEGLPWRRVGEEIGEDGVRAEIMSRAAQKRFAAAVRTILERDGVPPERVQAEIHQMIDVPLE